MARSRRPAGLPDFHDPPLTEVVLSVQFDGLSPIEFIDLGSRWRRSWSRRYPKIEYHPPLPPAFEIFGMPAAPVSVQIQLSQIPDMPRLWFINEAGTEVLQVQRDRFVHNWRKVGTVEYLRYENIRRTFLGEFLKLTNIIESHLQRHLTLNQCEVTYVNHVSPEDSVNFFETVRIPEHLPIETEFEDLAMLMRFALPGPGHHAAARLIVQAGPAVTRDGTQVFQFMLTVRGRPMTPDIEGVRAFIDKGRIAIVENFTALTTERMHRMWGRRK